jgi:hypothetical protein
MVKIGFYNYWRLTLTASRSGHSLTGAKPRRRCGQLDCRGASGLPRKSHRSRCCSSLMTGRLRRTKSDCRNGNFGSLPTWLRRFSRGSRGRTPFLFECVALQTENLTVKLFTEPKQLRDRAYWRITFDLFHDEPGAVWTFKARSAYRGHGCAANGLIELRQRIVEATAPRALHPSQARFDSVRRRSRGRCLGRFRRTTKPSTDKPRSSKPRSEQ